MALWIIVALWPNHRDTGGAKETLLPGDPVPAE